MKSGVARFVLSSLLLPAAISWADFKYSETTKISGGAMAGMVKFASSVSGRTNQPLQSTKYVKGNRMRIENADGSAQIIDLDGRRIISVDSARKTYGVITFDEMRAQIQAMQQRLQAAQAEKNAQFSVSPKVQVTSTPNTRSILGETAREVQVKVDMNMQAQSSDRSSGNAQGTMTLENELWIGGYDEVKEFYRRMAEELNWVPGGGATDDPRMAKAMTETLKNSEALKGMPLLEVLKLKPSGTPQTSGSNAPGTSSESSASTNSNQALVKGLGGIFGGKKKKDQSQNDDPSHSSLMTTTMEVTSFSSSALDSHLFEIPAGYTQIQANPNEVLAGGRSR
jgi:hypothetical protein